MISAWLTCAEAWLIALAKAPSFSAAVECSRRYEHAMDEVRDVLESNEKADHTIQALANRSVW